MEESIGLKRVKAKLVHFQGNQLFRFHFASLLSGGGSTLREKNLLLLSFSLSVDKFFHLRAFLLEKSP